MQDKIFFGNRDHLDLIRYLFIITAIFFVLGLCNKYMCKRMVFLQLEQPVKIMSLIPLNAKPPGKTAAPRLRLVKLIAHLCNLRMRHADPGIINIDNQINSIAFPAKFNTDANTSLFCKFKGILQKDLKDMRYFFHISDKHGRYFRIHIEYKLQLVPAVLHSDRRNDIIEKGRNHIWF